MQKSGKINGDHITKILLEKEFKRLKAEDIMRRLF
jgi:hypothetical protein